MPLNESGICPQEQIAQSGAPMGTVRNEEALARIALTPVHFQNGKIAHSLFPIDDLKKRGWSFVRKAHADENRMRCIGELLATQGKRARRYVGYVQIQADKIRAINDSKGKQALCVVDDALQDFAEHALTKESANRPPFETRKIRSIIMGLAKLTGVSAADNS